MILQGESYEFGTVFQTVAFFLFVIPRLRPGLLSLRSVLSSRQILLLFGSLLFGNIGNQLNNKITKQQDNKTTKKTRIATFIFDGAFIAQE